MVLFYDTVVLGRTPVTYVGSGAGCSTTYCYNVLNSQGSTAQIKVTTTTVNVNTAFGQSGVTEFSGSFTAIQSIQLPDGTSYQFSYDSGTTAGHYGALTSMTLPTSGQVNYGYTNFADSYANKNRWVSSRVSGAGTWSYTPAVVSSCQQGTVGCQQKVTVTTPSSDNTVYTFTLNNGAWVSSALSYTGAISTANLLSTVASTWDFSQACSPTPCTGAKNIRILTTTTTLTVPGGSITNQTKTAYADANTMNVASVKSWKFYSGTSPTFPTTPDSETDYTYLATTPYTAKNILNRVLTVTVKSSSGSVVAQTNYSYDDAGALSNSTPANGIAHHDDTNYGLGNTVRGNLATISRCTNLSLCTSSPVKTTLIYDTTGQVLSITDPNTNVTSFGYADNFFTDASPATNPPAATSPTPPTTNAYLTSITQPIIGTSNFGYYYGTGKRAAATDPNNANVFNHFLDSLDRLTHTYGPLIGTDRPWNLNVYSATNTQVDSYVGITDATASPSCSACRHDQVVLDGFARLIHSYLVGDTEGQDKVDVVYDSSGRVQSTSHPYRVTTEPTYGLETPAYDGLNRITSVTHQDGTFSQVLFGAAVGGGGLNARTTQSCSSSTYGLGYPSLFIDEAGKKREIWTDGFGRTIEGDEPDSSGNLTTGSVVCYSYTYDANGNVLFQAVSGSQTRTSQYDVVSRLTSVAIPEISNSSGQQCSGTNATTYSYDSNGNILSRVAPAPNQTACTSKVTTTYGYDALNRLTQVSYNDGATPTVKYGYDGTALSGCATAPPALTDSFPKGRLTAMCDGSGATSWAHDATGHVLTEKRIILGVTKTISYAYNLDGSIKTITYPGSKVVTYTVSNAQRLTSAKDNASGTQFAIVASYAAAGSLQSVITGQVSGGFGGVTESHTYNSRLEYTGTKAMPPSGTAALDLTLQYALTGGDNGSVTTITNNVVSGRTETIAYDSLNRVLSAVSSATSGVNCWGQKFGPDGTVADDSLANLTKINSGTQALPPCPFGMLSATVDANNRMNTDSTFATDAAGNMFQDGKPAGYSYSFDPENRIKKATGMTGGPYCYVYDGNGLRVAKRSGAASDCTGGTVTKLYWRSVSGDSLAETDGTGSTTNAAYSEYVFFAGRRIASRNGLGAIFYYFADNLGSTRTITTGNGPGQTSGQLCYDADFTPYGQEISHSDRLQTTACPPSYKFTGYERDPETAYGANDTGLDYAIARYYSSRLGRFLSTDPLGGAVGSLQSHNAYAYTLNNPMNMVDPLGLNAGCPNNPNIPAGTTCGPPPNVPYGGVCGGSPTCDPVGGGVFTCTIDGVQGSCSMALGLLQGGAAIPCPPNLDCNLVIAMQGPGGMTVEKRWQPPEDTSHMDSHGWVIGLTIGYWKTISIRYDAPTVTTLGWWQTAAGTFFSPSSFAKAERDAWNNGYFGCVANGGEAGSLAKPVANKLVEAGAHQALEGAAPLAAGAYYHVTDARFTAWGKYSKVLVPRRLQPRSPPPSKALTPQHGFTQILS